MVARVVYLSLPVIVLVTGHQLPGDAQAYITQHCYRKRRCYGSNTNRVGVFSVAILLFYGYHA